MIDREARNKVAKILRQYAAGQITNDDLDDNRPLSEDRAVKAMNYFAWTLHGYMEEYKAVDWRTLDRTTKNTIARCILFLKSNEIYSYPEHTVSYSNSRLVPNWAFKTLNHLTFGKYNSHIAKKDNEYYNAGDASIWPFKSRQQLKAVEKQMRKNGKGLMPQTRSS